MSENTSVASSSSITAAASKDLCVRLLIVAGLLAGMGAWFAWDGYLATGGKDLTLGADGKAVNKIIAGKYDYAPRSQDLNVWLNWSFNHYGPFLLIPAGLVFAALALRSAKRHVHADAEGIGFAGGEKFRWSDVAALDASQLKSKKILRLRRGDGQCLVLDAYKLTGFKDLVSFIETHTPAAARPTLAPATEKSPSAAEHA
ncbi:MAG: hypothetical protein ABFD92_20045 [Planctomycetaceae bacterium]|nr:hypothetical protein [Planctomycetaceae bacterium]